MSFNPADPAGYLEDLTQLTERLAALIQIETVALKERRPLALKETEDEKTGLMKTYAAEMQRIRKMPGFLKRGPKPLRDRLAQATLAFHAALDDQQRSLGAMKTVTERMVEAIAREAQKIRRPAGTYGRNAAYAAPAGGAKPFALNSVA